jgi:tRNA(fMet)-specific endonuclease VapC
VILVDTDICIEILNRNERVVQERARYDEDAGICFMSIAELYYGSAMSSDPAHNNALIEEFLLTVIVVQTDLPILRRFGRLKSQLRSQGLLLPDADILIAASALEKASVLVTGNTKHFERFPGLHVENWLP